MFKIFSLNPVKIGLTLLLAWSVSYSAAAKDKPKQTKNPLLIGFNEVIDFKNVSKTDVKTATDGVIAETKVSLEKIYKVKPKKRTFENTMLALDDLYDRYSQVAGGINILSNASPDSAIRNQTQKSLAQLSQFGNELSLDEKLYRAVKDFAQTPEAKALTGSRKKFLTETVE